MATPTITFTGTTLSTAESTTGWQGRGGLMTPLSVTDFYRQGSASVGSDAKTANLRGVSYGAFTPFNATTNLILIWVWVASEKSVSDFASGGVRLFVSSDTNNENTNYKEYAIGGNDVDWVGKGWRLLVCDPQEMLEVATAGTTDLTAIEHIGVTCDFTSTLGRADGMAVDVIRYVLKTDKKVMEVTGGTSSDPITLQGIVDQDGAGGGDTHYGALYQDANGLKLNNGFMVIGDVSGAVNTYLEDEAGEVIVAQDQPCGDGNTGIRILHDTGTTETIFGTKVGTGLDAVGSNGFTYLNTNKFWTKDAEFEAKGTGINTFGLYGCSFSDMAVISLGIDGTTLGGTTDTIELIDNQFIRTQNIIKNIGVTPTPATLPTAPLLVNNKIAFNKDYRASLDIEDQNNLFGYQFQYIQSSGFIETTSNGGSVTFDAKGYDFNAGLVPYVNITDADEIWDIINPNWTIEPTKEKQLDFSGVPVVTDNGEITADSVSADTGNQRNCVRRSNGDLYFAYVNSIASQINMKKSLDDGATWSADLDSTNEIVPSINAKGISMAIDGNDVIHIIWYDGTGTDLIKYTTFDTDTDEWNGGSPATETTVKSGVTVNAFSMSIAVDSQNDAHVTYIDNTTTNGNTLYYNNSIDFSTNEVSLNATTQTSSALLGHSCDIAIRPSDDKPIILSYQESTDASTTLSMDFSVWEGNVRDATSFTENILKSYNGVNFLTDPKVSTDPVLGGEISLCIADNDDILCGYVGENIFELFVYKHSGNDVFTSGWGEPEGFGSFSADDTISLTASNNKIYLVFADVNDDEIKYFESKNYGVGWSDPVAVTTTTTSGSPLLRANHGLHEVDKNKIDIIYRDSVDDPQHAYLENVGNAGVVNEKFELTSTAKEPSGTLISDSRIKIVETNEKDLEISNDINADATSSITTTTTIQGTELNFTKPTKVTKVEFYMDNASMTAGTIRAVVINGHTVSTNNGTIQYASPTINITDMTNETVDRKYIFTFTSPIPLTGDVIVGLEGSGLTGTSLFLRKDNTTPTGTRWAKGTISTGNWNESTGEQIAMKTIGIEEQTTSDLALEASTGASGESVVSEYPTNKFQQNGDGLYVHRHENTNFKSYKYGKLPFVTNVGLVGIEKDLDAIHLSDIYQIQGTPATAITLGDTTNTVSITKQTNPASIIKFTAGTGTLDVGNTVTGGTSGATGVVLEILEGDSTAGTLLLDTRNTINFSGTESLAESGASSDWAGTLTTSSQVDFTWLINADTLTAQQLYDYLMAKLNEATADTSPPINDVIIWGRAEHGTPLQGTATSPNKFQTVRNTTSTEGWAIYGLTGGLGNITQYTADDGTAFIPVSTVPLTLHVERKDGLYIGDQNSLSAIGNTNQFNYGASTTDYFGNSIKESLGWNTAILNTVDTKLYNSGGTSTGNVKMVIIDGFEIGTSNGTVIATSNETVDVSTLTSSTAGEDVTWTFPHGVYIREGMVVAIDVTGMTAGSLGSRRNGSDSTSFMDIVRKASGGGNWSVVGTMEMYMVFNWATSGVYGASVIILQSSDNSIIAQGTTDVNGDFSTNFTYTTDVPVTTRCRLSTLPPPRYFNEEAVNTISSTGMNQNFALREDIIVSQG